MIADSLNPVQAHALNEILTGAVYTNTVKPGDHVIDLGANRGDHTRELAKIVGPEGLVHAFEPNWHHFRALSEIDNTRLWPYAAGDVLAVEHLHVPAGLDGWASLKNIAPELPDRKFEILTVTQIPVDAATEIDFARVTFVKVDVERREKEALRGMTELLRIGRAVIVLENLTEEIRQLIAGTYTVHPLCDLCPLPNVVLLPTGASVSVLPTPNQVRNALKIAIQTS